MCILNEIQEHDAPEKGKGRDGVIKQPHFQPVTTASVWSGKIFYFSNLKKKKIFDGFII